MPKTVKARAGVPAGKSGAATGVKPGVKTSAKTSAKTSGRSREVGPRDELAREPGLERGTVEHYADPLLYDHEYRRRRADVNYYRALVQSHISGAQAASTSDVRPGEVLELGCGTGRLLVPLLRDGARVVGVDLSRPMLRRCAERVARLSPPVRERALLLRADFRRLSLGRRFSLILTPFNAMMHLYTRSDLERFLDMVKAHLAPGGTFAFDVMNPDLEWLMRNPLKRWARTRFKDPRTGRVYHYSTNHAYDAATQINWIRLFYDEAPDGDRSAASHGSTSEIAPRRAVADQANPPLPLVVRSRVVHLSQRQLFPEELAALLHYNGFTVDQRDGGFLGERFEAESESQVCRCSIREGSRR